MLNYKKIEFNTELLIMNYYYPTVYALDYKTKIGKYYPCLEG